MAYGEQVKHGDGKEADLVEGLCWGRVVCLHLAWLNCSVQTPMWWL